MLGGRTVRVVIDPDLALREQVQGQSCYNECVIKLMPVSPAYTAEAQAQTFAHELVHWLLHSAAEGELCGNEQLVDVLGTFLHQAMVTMQYEVA